MSRGKLTELLQPLIEDLGYEFVGLEQRSEPKNQVVVVYIDRPEGIRVEDCEKVSREISALLDVEDPISGQYRLEVSSPGLDRPLFHYEQFTRFAGQEVKVTLYAPQGGSRKFKGIILGADEETLRLEQEGQQVTLDMGNIAKARLVPDYGSFFADGNETLACK